MTSNLKLQNIYKKQIDRRIDGVIKADDASSLKIEAEEYVLTNEISNRLANFLDAYNNYNSANGVWISGFFGSGKSHLLKMLSLLLEDKEIDGVKVLDLFLQKTDDEILKAEINKACKIPSQSILFNIDQKADVISKTEIDALLSVFVKVFDETCGYYGKQGHIAKFERDIDSRNHYQAFQESFKKHSGKDWEKGREQAILESASISKAYAEVMGGDPSDYKEVLTKYRNDYKVSIEDFANQVWSYIQTKGKNFRLNFFVDEVGQYIADNIKLMTNLQTIAESLATKCKGQAWLIVTAQEDMSNVVGEFNKQQSNDFSKIQARFANKMKLTSQNVDEVIQKRLLSKTEEAKEALEQLYKKHCNDFGTLFNFVDGSQTYANYRDCEHFINSYPFVPYQFGLFQASIQNLSIHNAFEGRHSSVGERSMLGVFQNVAIYMKEQELGKTATFDLMFDGIENTLKSQIQSSVSRAKQNLPNEYAIRVLKALFLVKHIKEFKPTITNICILMREAFDQNALEHKKRVEEALNLLENESYIKRNTIYFEFLTDEEKDIEKEIKNTDIEQESEAKELLEIVFNDILKENKIQYEKNKQFYKFARKLDGNLYGNRDFELSINIISPFYEHADNKNILHSHNIGLNELMVVMGSDSRLYQDLAMYLKTEKYIRVSTKTAQKPTVTKILAEKREQNNFLKQDILQSVKRLLSKAELIVSGNDVEVGSSDPQTRIVQGFQNLITYVYPQLKILKDLNYKEEDIIKALNPADDLLGADVTSLSEAEQEVLNFINLQSRQGVRTTLKSVVDNFEKKPYGWYLNAVLYMVAKLNTRGKIECLSDSNILDGADLEKSLKNTHIQPNIILKPQQDFAPALIARVKEFYENFFDENPATNEAKALGHKIAEAFKEKHHELEKLSIQASQYQFLKSIDEILPKLKELSGKIYSFYFENISSFEDELLSLKESVLEPIENFMGGEKKEIYKNIKDFLKEHEHDFGYMECDEKAEIETLLSSYDCYKGNAIKEAKDLHKTLKQRLDETLKQTIRDKQAELDALKAKISSMEEFSKLGDAEKKSYQQAFDSLKDKIANTKTIVVINSMFSQFEKNDYPQMLNKLTTKKGEEKQEKHQVISAKDIKVSYKKPLLSSKADVEEYVKSYQEALIEEINKGKKVQV